MEATITKTNPLGAERVGKLMMRYAVPSIISIVVNSLYNMVDQVFIGQGVGYLGNAATNVIPVRICHQDKVQDSYLCAATSCYCIKNPFYLIGQPQNRTGFSQRQIRFLLLFPVPCSQWRRPSDLRSLRLTGGALPTPYQQSQLLSFHRPPGILLPSFLFPQPRRLFQNRKNILDIGNFLIRDQNIWIFHIQSHLFFVIAHI